MSLKASVTQEEYRLTDFVSSSSQLFHGLLVQDFSSSCPNLVTISKLLEDYLLQKFLFQSSEFGHHISVLKL